MNFITTFEPLSYEDRHLWQNVLSLVSRVTQLVRSSLIMSCFGRGSKNGACWLSLGLGDTVTVVCAGGYRALEPFVARRDLIFAQNNFEVRRTDGRLRIRRNDMQGGPRRYTCVRSSRSSRLHGVIYVFYNKV